MDDEEHKCHCHHVVVVLHDFKRINWAIGLLFAASIAIMVKEAWSMERAHIRDDSPPARSGERLFQDRVEHEP